MAVEAAAFARGVGAGDLMESAGSAIAEAVRQFFPAPGHAVAFCGKGNNAGDVLVAARHLCDRGWSIGIDCPFDPSELSDLARRHLDLLGTGREPIPNPQPTLLLDGLLGIGAKGPPREPIASAIRRLNALRLDAGAFVAAADVPSGLNADTGDPADPCVRADLTITIGHAKTGLVADAAANFVGRLALAPLPALSTGTGDPAQLLTPDLLRPHLPPRDFNSHKGTWGRVGIIAGSRGFLGAARLCSEAAVRAGAGLVTLYAKPGAYELLAGACAPEVMVRPVNSYSAALDDRLDAIGIGPGLGGESDEEILNLVAKSAVPMVIDADALNALSRHPGVLHQPATISHQLLLTPHPGEMARLFPESMTLTRRETAEAFVHKYPVTLLLKGSRTLIAGHDCPVSFNTTGNPGMGSGGMGDVLTGVCAAFLGQGKSPAAAAMLGAWLSGRAAERFVFAPGGSPESLAATDVIANLGGAFGDLRHGF